jgi:5-hydroxyisourate hydrolase-like protein (transthyretin family)
VSEFRPTRRELIGAAAAASLLGPGAALAREGGRVAGPVAVPEVFARTLGTLSAASPELASARPFVLAGVEWSGPTTARIELRARALGGKWSPWATASTLGHDADGPAASDRLYGDPLWFGVADAFQVRASEPVRGLAVHFVDARGILARAPRANATAARAFPLAQPILDAGPGQPPIIARTAWAGDHAPPAFPPEYGDVRLAFVHHTDNPNGYAAADVPAMLFAMYQFHRFVRGWNDIGYNFVVDLYGRIWEAREGGIDQAVIGAQAGGYNLESTGVSVLGTFSDVVPSAAAISAVEHVLAWKLSLHGLPSLGEVTVEVNPTDAFYTPFRGGTHIALPRVAGHRQGCSTDCPGDAFFARLPSMRPTVARLAGRPAKVTLAASGSGSTPASYLSLATVPALAGASGEVSGRLSLLAGEPLADAPIEIQQLRPGGSQTIARTTTAEDGRWIATIALQHTALIRALHRAEPATASPLVVIEVAPAITLTLETASPLVVQGTVAPATRRVELEVHRVEGTRKRLVAHRRVTVEHGRFTARLKLTPGSYELIARTTADDSNAAGASAPLTVTV